MLNSQPDIAQQQALVRLAELQLRVARNQLLPRLSLDTLDQLNGLGQQLDSEEAVLARYTLKALNPIVADMEKSAGRNANPVNYSSFSTTESGLAVPPPSAIGRLPAK